MKSKSRFLTYVFSLVPGAGQMYLGFMKQGITIMSLFFFSIFLADFFRISLLFAALPVVWCYSFFDTINKASLTQEEFERLEDKSIFSGVFPDAMKMVSGRYKWLGAALIILGLFLIIDNVILNELGRFNLVDRYVAREYIRTIIASGIIIGLGVKLIFGQKVGSRVEKSVLQEEVE